MIVKKTTLLLVTNYTRCFTVLHVNYFAFSTLDFSKFFPPLLYLLEFLPKYSLLQIIQGAFLISHVNSFAFSILDFWQFFPLKIRPMRNHKKGIKIWIITVVMFYQLIVHSQIWQTGTIKCLQINPRYVKHMWTFNDKYLK